MCNTGEGIVFGKKFQFVEGGAAYRKRLFVADNKPDYLPRVFCFSLKFQIKSLSFRGTFHVCWCAKYFTVSYHLAGDVWTAFIWTLLPY